MLINQRFVSITTLSLSWLGTQDQYSHLGAALLGWLEGIYPLSLSWMEIPTQMEHDALIPVKYSKSSWWDLSVRKSITVCLAVYGDTLGKPQNLSLFQECLFSTMRPSSGGYRTLASWTLK